MLWHNGWPCFGSLALGRDLGFAFICAGDLEIPADPYRSGQSSASLAVKGRRDLWYWQVPSVLVHNAQGKWLIPFCSSVSVTLLLKCLGDVGLIGQILEV